MIVLFLPSNHKAVLESILLTAKGARKDGAWNIVCSEYTPQASASPSSSSSTSTSSTISSSSSATTPSIWRCTSTTYPTRCCFVHEKHILTGAYNEQDRSRSLEQFIIHDKSDRYQEHSVWSIKGYQISLQEQHLYFRIGSISLGGTTEVYDGVCLSIECRDTTASRDERLQQIVTVCRNIEEALKQHQAGGTDETKEPAIQLSKFDQLILSKLQARYCLSEHSPMEYEALQVLDVVQKLRLKKKVG